MMCPHHYDNHDDGDRSYGGNDRDEDGDGARGGSGDDYARERDNPRTILRKVGRDALIGATSGFIIMSYTTTLDPLVRMGLCVVVLCVVALFICATEHWNEQLQTPYWRGEMMRQRRG